MLKSDSKVLLNTSPITMTFEAALSAERKMKSLLATKMFVITSTQRVAPFERWLKEPLVKSIT